MINSENTDRAKPINELLAEIARLRAENAGLRETLTYVRRAIIEAGPAGVTDTIWIVSPCSETAVDCIDAALSSEPQAAAEGER